MKFDRSEYGKVFEFGFREDLTLLEHTPRLPETAFRRLRNSLLSADRPEFSRSLKFMPCSLNHTLSLNQPIYPSYENH